MHEGRDRFSSFDELRVTLRRAVADRRYSHSTVAGGFDVMS
jgi:hypothetical protein